MNKKSVVENLRKIADILENDQELYLNNVLIEGIKNMELHLILDTNEIIGFPVGSGEISNRQAYQFSEIEKVILRNIADDLHFIARDNLGNLALFQFKPKKGKHMWDGIGGYKVSFNMYKYLFEHITWEDTEPCEFRRYL